MNSKLVFRLALAAALLAGVVAVALYAYNLGMARGLLHVPQAVYVNIENLYGYNVGLDQDLAGGGQAPAQPPGPAPQPYPGQPFHYGPFGFAGLRCLFPLLFLAFVFVVLRHLLWRRHWHGGWHHHRWEKGAPPFFEEWHRRTHESESGKV